jgi:hypothetical protein
MQTRNSEYRIYVLLPCRFVESFVLRSCFRLKSFIGKFALKVLGEEFACLNLHYMSRICGQWSLKSNGRLAAYENWGSCGSDCSSVDGYCLFEKRTAILARIVPWRWWQLLLQKRTSVPNVPVCQTYQCAKLQSTVENWTSYEKLSLLLGWQRRAVHN